MEIITVFAFFILGFIMGVMFTIALVVHIAKRLTSPNKTTTAKTYPLAVRMERITKLTTERMELLRRVEEPQKNALDGKYKNSLIARIKTLDEEKADILRSIIAEGYDPELSAKDSAGVVTHMKLSEYMTHMGIPLKPNKPKTEKVRKFTVYRGGKDDGGNNTTH